MTTLHRTKCSWWSPTPLAERLPQTFSKFCLVLPLTSQIYFHHTKYCVQIEYDCIKITLFTFTYIEINSILTYSTSCFWFYNCPDGTNWALLWKKCSLLWIYLIVHESFGHLWIKWILFTNFQSKLNTWPIIQDLSVHTRMSLQGSLRCSQVVEDKLLQHKLHTALFNETSENLKCFTSCHCDCVCPSPPLSSAHDNRFYFKHHFISHFAHFYINLIWPYSFWRWG